VLGSKNPSCPPEGSTSVLWESPGSPVAGGTRTGFESRNSEGNQKWCTIWGFQTRGKSTLDSCLGGLVQEQLGCGREGGPELSRQQDGASSGMKEKGYPPPHCPRLDRWSLGIKLALPCSSLAECRAHRECSENIPQTTRDLLALGPFVFGLQNHALSKARTLPV
jgi:hypothetical protein